MTKVLFLSGAQGADYQCDMLLHGFRSLLGPDCVDANKLGIMYQGSPPIGFWSIYGNLPDVEIDRTDIPAKISARYFDVIVYGSIHRDHSYIDLVTASYPPSRIAFVDGEDDHGIAPVLGRGVYFKRELTDDFDTLLPIQFAIPRDKIRSLDSLPPKARLMSPLDPRDRSTYIYYGTESSYYDQYSVSYFGRTMKKGGWDCCRHYEIMAAGALPYFHDLEACPAKTMFRLPKAELKCAYLMHDNWHETRRAEWDDLMTRVHAKLHESMTTEAMASYVLNKVHS